MESLADDTQCTVVVFITASNFLTARPGQGQTNQFVSSAVINIQGYDGPYGDICRVGYHFHFWMDLILYEEFDSIYVHARSFLRGLWIKLKKLSKGPLYGERVCIKGPKNIFLKFI